MQHGRINPISYRFWGSKERFGVLKYESWNLGDDMQSLAARQYLPTIDYYISRDNPSEFKDRGPIKTIMNGWFMGPFNGKPLDWPPPPNIHPLFISFHVGREELAAPKYKDYYKQFEPIGCRGYRTLELMTDLGIDAYFSGCLTLTLQNPYSDKDRTDDIYFVDPFSFGEGKRYPKLDSPDFRNDLWEKIPEEVREKATYLRHTADVPGEDYGNPYKRFNLTRSLFERYARAKLVVTGRIHCALPCLALGTPVIFLTDTKTLESDTRMGGLIDLFRNYSFDQILDGDFDVNWENPEPNPVDISEMAGKMRRTCEAFIKGS
ncbi:MAG: polysaccharide pyruvyl transferase family protein [Cyanobacteria bacterium P01_D01_bin.73]